MITREYFGEDKTIAVVVNLIRRSASFDVEPFPCNIFCVTVDDAYEALLPVENIGRDALSESEDTDDVWLVCKYCARKYEGDGCLFEGDPCPSDDCPSHTEGNV